MNCSYVGTITPQPTFLLPTMKYIQLGSILALCSMVLAATIPDVPTADIIACIKDGRKPIVPGTACGQFP